jgi:hypothetical protein
MRARVIAAYISAAVGLLLTLAGPAQAKEIHAFSTSFGAAGEGSGQFATATNSYDTQDIAVDNSSGPSAGDVYVTDPLNQRVEKFGPSGEFILMFGGHVDKTTGGDICTAASHDICQAGTLGTAPGELGYAGFIAVDGSSGSSAGDIYVGSLEIYQTDRKEESKITKFEPDGKLVSGWGNGGQLEPPNNNQGLDGVAVGPTGTLYALVERTLDEFSPSGSLTVKIATGMRYGAIPIGIAVDSSGDIYTNGEGEETGGAGAPNKIDKLGPSGEVLSKFTAKNNKSVAVDPSDGDLYGSYEGGSEGIYKEGMYAGERRYFERVTRYSSSGSVLESSIGYGEGLSEKPSGVAVNSVDHTVYVADPEDTDVLVFTVQNVEPPNVSVAAPSGVEFTIAHVSGTVDPEGNSTIQCSFEYVTSEHFAKEEFAGAESQACSPSPGKGSGNVSVEAELKGLLPSTSYRVRLLAENHAGQTVAEAPGVFTTKGPISGPTVTLGAVSDITSTSAVLSGQINPNAPGPAPGQDPGFDTKWLFECNKPSPSCGFLKGVVEADDSAHAIGGTITGLLPGTTYEVTLLGEDAGGKVEEKATFTTPPVAPTINSTYVVSAADGEALVAAEIDPGGATTGYRFQYLTEAQFIEDGEAFGAGTGETEETTIGAGDAIHKAAATIAGLKVDTVYRFRVIVNSEKTSAGGIAGSVGTLFTLASPSSTGCANVLLREESGANSLADCRGYEQVSPAGDAEVFIPFGQATAEDGLADTEWPMQTSPDGESVVYAAEPPSSGVGGGTGNAGGGEGDSQLATRSESGWSSNDIQPLGSRPETHYEAFSGNLATGVLVTGFKEALTSDTESECPSIYSRASIDGSYRPLSTGELTAECLSEGAPIFVGASSDYSQLLFESDAVLTLGAQKSTAGVGRGNLYDSADGERTLVNVLPGSSPEADPEASIGNLSSEPATLSGGGSSMPAIDADGAVSTDGSRVFWTDLKTGVVYVRENPTQEQGTLDVSGECTEASKACTLQVSAGAATYWAATPDGRYAYYVEKGELWRYDTENHARESVAGAGAEVQGVIGVNQTGEDGSYVYFVAEGKLSATAETRKCAAAGSEGKATTQEEEEAAEEARGETPTGRGCNLYVSHSGTTALVTVLLPGDDEFPGNNFGTGQPKKGDWRPVVGYRSAELTPDGTHLVFMSGRDLGAYDNPPPHAVCGGNETVPSHVCAEVYLYDTTARQISCVSCAPSGAPPSEPAENDGGAGSTYLPGDFASVTHMRRWISADGDRVFFNTNQPLVPQDKNKAEDVYEWERPGTGSCAVGSAFNGGGCVYLISPGTGPAALLLDSDETGDNVFFVTRSGIVPGSLSERPRLYDARVNGGFAAAPGESVQAPPCLSAEACKPPPGEPPVESFPASASFSGAGNLIPPLETVKPPATKKPAAKGKQTNAQKLASALKACHKKTQKQKRKACETQARKRYAPAKKSKKAKKAKGK